jgi:hypothetical protein
MPYHRLGQGKTTRFGAHSQDFRVPDADEVTRWNQLLNDAIARQRAEGR